MIMSRKDDKEPELMELSYTSMWDNCLINDIENSYDNNIHKDHIYNKRKKRKELEEYDD